MSFLFALLFATQQLVFLPVEPPPLPDITVTVQDFINTMAEFDIVQESNKSFCSTYHALTDFDNHTISICSLRDNATRRLAVLHEVVHIIYSRMGIVTGGEYENPLVQQIALKLYGEIYGPKTPVQEEKSTQ